MPPPEMAGVCFGHMGRALPRGLCHFPRASRASPPLDTAPMMILGRAYAEKVTVGTVPTRLDGSVENRPLGARKSFLVGNGTGTIYIGGPEVTTSTGYALIAGTPISFDAVHGVIWAVSASPVTVDLLEAY